MRKLYSYFRSSAAYRVRIALAFKGLDYQTVPVHLLRDGGEQHAPAYRDKNPAGLVPALEEAGQALTQSLAIIEYLEETYP
ncbi:MAG: glutathione S-transferase N-terminal domain-containing protein, partial [Paludibacterium sp.]